MYNVNEARKRSSYGYHTVTTVTTVGEDRRGTQETQEQIVDTGSLILPSIKIRYYYGSNFYGIPQMYCMYCSMSIMF